VLLAFCILSVHAHAQQVVCSNGFGSFKSGFATGVTVSVGAARNVQFAARSCEARLIWDKQELIVEPNASQVDVDAFGVDLKLGSPVVAFQVRKDDVDGPAKYEIYSLKKPPRLLRTILASSHYSASDTDLDGQVEIWADDAAAVSGFENIPLDGFDFAPAVVLRFEREKLIDVSSEFQSDFDHQITKLRAQLSAEALREFQHSNGSLSGRSFVPGDQLHRLITAKTKVLEIVWCYLYSNREEEAWNILAAMWPPEDFDRIRAAIVKAHATGIRSQIDGVSSRSSRDHLKKKHAMIFDRLSDADTERGNALGWDYSPGQSGPVKVEQTFGADTAPIQLLLRWSAPIGYSSAALTNEAIVNLVIDSAGKVRSATSEGKPDKSLIDATEGWKFIPAFKDGHPVAARLRIGVTPTQ
jgi:hypothetical protein